MASIDNITVEDFKNLFTRDFPYLPLYIEGKAYFKDDIVYVEPNFYKCLTDGTTTAPPSEPLQKQKLTLTRISLKTMKLQ